MSRKSKGQLFGVFDEQAISVITVLGRKEVRFGELLSETGLSKASLARVLKHLERAAIVGKTLYGYTGTPVASQILDLVLKIAERQNRRMLNLIEYRLSRMERDYLATRRIFHHDSLWERTGEKALAEVMSVRSMTPIQSLLFQQRFQEEAVREEQKLRRSPTTK